ncbi:MAG TPA: hypothetical protein VL025_15770 [Thermoanaerobaculia bacterium]|nr:hypothetical protein [Thermoanaerobaculia bacterium]
MTAHPDATRGDIRAAPDAAGAVFLPGWEGQLGARVEATVADPRRPGDDH